MSFLIWNSSRTRSVLLPTRGDVGRVYRKVVSFSGRITGDLSMDEPPMKQDLNQSRLFRRHLPTGAFVGNLKVHEKSQLASMIASKLAPGSVAFFSSFC